MAIKTSISASMKIPWPDVDELIEDQRPGDKEDHFNVEQDKQHGDQVKRTGIRRVFPGPIGFMPDSYGMDFLPDGRFGPKTVPSVIAISVNFHKGDNVEKQGDLYHPQSKSQYTLS
jgi:hypothetical protein